MQMEKIVIPKSAERFGYPEVGAILAILLFAYANAAAWLIF